MTSPQKLAANLASVRARIDAAAARSRFGSAPVTLVAVTKTVGPDAARALAGLGQHDMGENRAQELMAKQEALADLRELRWHFIGRLQTNKVKLVAGKVLLVHSLDSEHLLAALDARAARLGVLQDALIEVNVSRDAAKAGFDEAGAEALFRSAAHYPNVRLRGLMTMAPLVEPEACRPVFAAARRLFDHLREADYPCPEVDILSMGMTNDFEVAIEEGSTCVRIGTALFT